MWKNWLLLYLTGYETHWNEVGALHNEVLINFLSPFRWLYKVYVATNSSINIASKVNRSEHDTSNNETLIKFLSSFKQYDAD